MVTGVKPFLRRWLFFSSTGFNLWDFSRNFKIYRLKPVLLGCKRQAVYGFCDYVFLELDKV